MNDQDDSRKAPGEATQADAPEEDASSASSEQQNHSHLMPPFLPDQRVFCFDTTNAPKSSSPASGRSSGNISHSPQKQLRYYEAVVRQVRHHPNMTNLSEKWSFLVHYQGWNARWDHWVSPSQLIPDTMEHRQKYEEQQKQDEAKRQVEAKKQKQPQQQKKKKKKEQSARTAQGSNTDLFGCLPFTLKIVLIDEWEKINRRGYDAPHGFDNDFQKDTANSSKALSSADSSLESMQTRWPSRSVHSLPAAVTVRQLLKHFEKKERKKWQLKIEEIQQQKKGSDETNDDKESPTKGSQQPKETIPSNPKLEVRQFCKGLGRLFEEALPVCLLYPQERPQYQHYITGGSAHAIDVYGCEFLLRLLVRLPYLVKRPLERPAFLRDLIVLLQQNRPACIKGNFRAPQYPHEWLEWEKNHYGDPRQYEAKRAKSVGAKDEEGER